MDLTQKDRDMIREALSLLMYRNRINEYDAVTFNVAMQNDTYRQEFITQYLKPDTLPCDEIFAFLKDGGFVLNATKRGKS